MSKVIDIERLSNGGATIQVDGGIIRGIDQTVNIIVKPIDNATGCVIKSPGEDFRCQLHLDDTITINGTPAPTVLNDLIEVLLNWVFGGDTAYVTPTKLANVITFAAPAGRAHTAPPFLAGATASSGLGVTYVSSDPTKATVDATTGLITPIAAGTTTITASQAGNQFYAAAVDVPHDLVLS